nr:HRDC domain-containing protein [Ammoniphilus sp. CFH 90114]
MAKSTFDVVNFSRENHNKLVFETLRGWRKKKAALDNAPAYTIMEDKSLLILATFIPHTQEEFLSLPYFKEKRWEQYGVELLDILKKYKQSYNIFDYFPRYVSVSPTVKTTKVEEPQSILQKIMGIFK